MVSSGNYCHDVLARKARLREERGTPVMDNIVSEREKCKSMLSLPKPVAKLRGLLRSMVRVGRGPVSALSRRMDIFLG